MKKSIITGLSLCLAYSLSAQEQPKHYELDSLLIEGKSKENSQKIEIIKNAQTTDVLSQAYLKRNNPNDLAQTLNTLPGVQVDKRTQFGGQRVVIRGYGNDQKFNNWGVKFYLNGAPITSADGVTILEDLDFGLINQMNVIKGPASALYGGGTGGVVNFIINTNQEKGVKISQNTLTGSFKTFGSSTRIDAKSENYSMLLNYSHLQSDGYRPRGKTNKNNYAFLGNFKLSPNQNINIYASHNNSFQGIDGQISYGDYYAGIDNGNAAYTRRNGHNHFISSRAIINHQWQLTPNISSNTTIFYHNLDTERAAAGAYETSEQPTYGARTGWTANYLWNEKFQTITQIGAEFTKSLPLISNYRFDGSDPNSPRFQTKDISKGGYFKYNNYNSSFFLSNRWIYTPYKLSLITGVSANIAGYQRKDLLHFPGLLPKLKKDASINKDFSIVATPHLAIQKEIGDNHILNLSYSEGYNSPTAATAYIKGISKTNDDLKPEHAYMWDLMAHGLIGKNQLWDYQISLFTMRINKKLSMLSARDEQNNAYSYFANTGKQHNKGMEFQLGYTHLAKGFVNRLRPFVNLSLYDFKYTDFTNNGKNFNGKKVVGVPSTKYTIGLDIDSPIGIYMTNTFSYLSDVYTNFSNTISAKGFSQYNAKLGYRGNFKNWNFDIFLLGNNLTNQINYTYLFVGNAAGDYDAGNGYTQNTVTDVNPGPAKAYFTGGLNIAYHF
ncbi:TonB-dependent receptor [Ornithobacterium rhinotracheale]|uniref:TonB-dependent receptor n=1 Tax=Ornithobacterium rhinotracheale TaxID=28251 RepID=UPI00129D08DC|nr:TonB-dependent receptor [Ornithobacterium rhinotracheale]MRJ08430.1 TonB-dependent receptor [Ornithobacterium rhinotracheale]UOH77624.1 TonB-dependent receptor plug domain-containing protein [Ornithobacterium rhinotracheale]